VFFFFFLPARSNIDILKVNLLHTRKATLETYTLPSTLARPYSLLPVQPTYLDSTQKENEWKDEKYIALSPPVLAA